MVASKKTQLQRDMSDLNDTINDLQDAVDNEDIGLVRSLIETASDNLNALTLSAIQAEGMKHEESPI